MIQSFDPKISLWLDDPVLLLKDADMSSPIAACQTWNADRRMPMAADSQQVFSSLMLCPKEYPDQKTMSSTRLWPPAMIPSSERIARITTSRDTFLPSRASEASTIGLRIKRWANFRFQMTPIDNEAISNYATLDPALYVPTKEKPYQGIWVGDYSAHGCEFLLIYQMTQPSGFSPVDGREGNHQWNTLRAVKLTGDPNVPRGEVTFVAHDIGPSGLIRVADEEPFVGARIVHCFGHVAGIGFRDGKLFHPPSSFMITSSGSLIYAFSLQTLILPLNLFLSPLIISPTTGRRWVTSHISVAWILMGF
jgi:hypothetical protein